MKIAGEGFQRYGQDVLEAFETRAQERGFQIAPNSYEGVRLSFDSEAVQGWMLLRMSLHDPLMPLNLEGRREGDCARLTGIAKELLAGFDRLDLSPLG